MCTRSSSTGVYAPAADGMPEFRAAARLSTTDVTDAPRDHFSKQYGRDVILDSELELTTDREPAFKQARPHSR